MSYSRETFIDNTSSYIQALELSETSHKHCKIREHKLHAKGGKLIGSKRHANESTAYLNFKKPCKGGGQDICSA